MVDAPWKRRSGLETVIDDWTRSRTVQPCFAADRLFSAKDGTYADLPRSLAPELAAALHNRGIDALYDHQARAWALARGEADPERTFEGQAKAVVVATPTASGKSLCFHLPVLQAIVTDPDARAIYVYPTKALSRDQEASLRELVGDAGLDVPAVVYDGDTPGDARRVARERSPIVLTNPDMLHAGILPHHANWSRTFQALKYVVIDELHTYRGVFGSHMAHVISRLRRIAQFHGSDPVFLCATATIGNPRAHAARLIGVDESQVALIDESGAPRGQRRFFFYNPPVVNAELGIRASYLKSAVRLASDLIRAQVSTIVFGQSRNSVELMLKYLRDGLGDEAPQEAIMAYRGGYLPEQRREIERGLRAGEILCVVATNALELGIDIGDLQAVICAGYPGSVAAMWQRFGRAGRRGELSAAILVGRSAPIDQYLARDPEFLLGSGAEEARIDPTNVEILVQHLKCAAFEVPFVCKPGSEKPDGGDQYASLDEDNTREALSFLAQHGVVHEAGGRFHWSADAYPANHVSLRSLGWDNFVIVDIAHGRSIAELDWRATHTMLHEQAIYQHDGEQYQVEKLDFENHKAFVRKVDPDYYTDALTYRRVSVIEQEATRSVGMCQAAWGEVSVVEKVVGYKKIKFHTHENVGYGDVRLPDMQMHTTSLWLTVPEELYVETGIGRAAAIDALRGIGRALEMVSSLALMCEPTDIGQTLGDRSGEEEMPEREMVKSPRPGFDPTIFLFDHIPGGVGIAERIYERIDELLARTHTLVRECDCEDGCPACVGPSEEGGNKRRLVAVRLLEAMRGLQ
ncbi:MAG: DEAD/DEAH box helicase [Deltaproteobacteria bacterium]|nr:DEAD/DEAH box helicase [Deltaproteobacteria bacterium]